ncbi:MAG: LysR family transcriptional regulator, partial [Comamonadaceae bacterium]
TFDALMRERSVSRAAARLFLSQPAVSASLNRLREAFDDPLFTRTSHGVVPTARAQALAPQVEAVLGGIAGLLDGGEPFNPGASGRIFRITGSDHASSLVLPALTRRLVELGSAIRIVWEPPRTWPLAERLYKGELDLAVVARIRRPQDLEARVLYQDHYVYAMRKDHPRAAEPVTLDSFCAVPQVFLGYGTSMLDDMIDEALALGGRQRLAQVAVTSFGQIVHQLRHSDHAAVLGNRVAQAHARDLAILALPLELPRYESLVCWHARAGADPGIQWLRDAVLETFGLPPAGEAGAAGEAGV